MTERAGQADRAVALEEAPRAAVELRAAKIVVVANRLPVRRMRRGDREVWMASPGGLVSALLPILQHSHEEGEGAAWIGWSGDRTRSYPPFAHEGVQNYPIEISSEEVEGYYDGMSNRTLWPLYHDVVRPPVYNRAWFRAYQAVNKRFAEMAARIAAPEGLVWVHDYHLHLVPGMLRGLRPDLRIGFFLHIPFPGRGLFAQLPWRRELIRGTLGADVVGFQTRYAAKNFIDLARRYADASATPGGVTIDGRKVDVDAFPISVDAKRIDELARSKEVRERVAEHRRRMRGRKVLLGVDRMDYTKGIDIRLRAFQELLRSKRVTPDEVVLIQSAVPTRERVDEYAALRSTVEELVGAINGEFAEMGRVAVEYLRQSLQLEDLVALYATADVMLVTPLRDGMNLIAKEYVAARPDERGVLVLSEFTGASAELTKALIVNPHDLDGLMNAMESAIRMNEMEMRRRLRAMRRVVFANDVYVWAERFMERLAG